ncbi:hypothetical protein FQA39_LY07726 [Lamprigera yunnana]|nr:hypothetical protein FQA39_LY07726 [Lamprigera yunnana]
MPKQNRKRKYIAQEDDDFEELAPKNKFKPFDKDAEAKEEYLSSILFGNSDSFIRSLDEVESETMTVTPTFSPDSGMGDEDISETLEKKPAWVDDDDGIDVGYALDIQQRKLPKGGVNHPSTRYSHLLKHKFQNVVGNPKWAALKPNQDFSDSDDDLLQSCGFLAKSTKHMLPSHTLELKKLKDLNSDTYNEGIVNCIEFHPTSTAALVAGNSGIASLFAVDGKRNNKLHSVSFERFPILSAQFINQGNECILGSHRSHIFNYDLIRGKAVRFPLPHGLTQCKQFIVSPDNKHIAVAGKWGEVHILSTKSKERICLLKQDSDVTALSFCTRGNLLYGHSSNGEVTIWDMNMRRVKHKWTDEGCIEGSAIALSSSNQFAAAGSTHGIVNLYGVEDILRNKLPKPCKTLFNLTTGITNLIFNSTSEIVAFSSTDIENSARLFHIGSGSVYSNFPPFGNKLVGSRLKMASAKFLEEALSTDVDESAVSAIVGSLENQLVTATPAPSTGHTNLSSGINQNHINSAISNGGTVPSQKHQGTIANGESMNIVSTAETNKILTNNALAGTIITGAAAQAATGAVQNQVSVGNYVNQTVVNNLAQQSKTNDSGGVKIVYSQAGQAMTNTGAVLSNRVTFPSQSVPNGTIGLSPISPQTTQTVLQTTTTNVQSISAKQQFVIKTSGAPSGNPSLMTVPMNVTAAVPPVNNVGSPSTQNSTILSNLQVVNVRSGVPNQPPKGQAARVVLSAPQMVGARSGAPQLTLQSLHGLQPGQQGHLLLKTENGQYQLLRVGPAPGVSGGLTPSTAAGVTAPLTFRMQTVPAGATVSSATTQNTPAVGVTTSTAPSTIQTNTPVQRPANDNTKEKCRKFLANLLELSSREPRSVERSVRTLIQELIDMRVEPEDFCDRLERLLNASPQPCLIGFLKKSLPLLRHSLATKELSIDGIRPPPPNVVFSIVSGAPTVQTQIRPIVATSQVRLVAPGTTVVRPGQVVQQRLVTPVRGTVQPATRMITTIRQPNVTTPVMVSSSQPPALHPVFPNNQIRPGVTVVRQPIPARTIIPGQIRSPAAARTAIPLQIRTPVTNFKMTGSKPTVPSIFSKPITKDKEKKSFSSAYTGDDDINDVAAMGGVNLAEESQRILGSTEFVGTQIRSCKEEFLLSVVPLQQRIKSALVKKGLDEPSNEVAAVISHAVQERLKNLIEKLAIITEHRLEMVKSDQRYEVTSDIKGQLKFLEDVDRAERKRHEELEREMLLRAAKSRSKTEDPEQAKLKAKAKEMQRVEMEELRQREANATALQAIGPRKRPRLDDGSSGTSLAFIVKKRVLRLGTLALLIKTC